MSLASGTVSFIRVTTPREWGRQAYFVELSPRTAASGSKLLEYHSRPRAQDPPSSMKKSVSLSRDMEIEGCTSR